MKRPKKVFVVYGQRGEYDTFSEWISRIYLDEDKANEYAEKKNEEPRESWDDTHFFVEEFETGEEAEKRKESKS